MDALQRPGPSQKMVSGMWQINGWMVICQHHTKLRISTQTRLVHRTPFPFRRAATHRRWAWSSATTKGVLSLRLKTIFSFLRRKNIPVSVVMLFVMLMTSGFLETIQYRRWRAASCMMLAQTKSLSRFQKFTASNAHQDTTASPILTTRLPFVRSTTHLKRTTSQQNCVALRRSRLVVLLLRGCRKMEVDGLNLRIGSMGMNLRHLIWRISVIWAQILRSVLARTKPQQEWSSTEALAAVQS
mmetsp:Transcript_25946/g.38365  ORF Transcript_25946/g.38365 Transcript_25946/m.38365 type:complete len:242 (+) Transcript_25946:1191-1916(+)